MVIHLPNAKHTPADVILIRVITSANYQHAAHEASSPARPPLKRKSTSGRSVSSGGSDKQRAKLSATAAIGPGDIDTHLANAGRLQRRSSSSNDGVSYGITHNPSQGRLFRPYGSTPTYSPYSRPAAHQECLTSQSIDEGPAPFVFESPASMASWSDSSQSAVLSDWTSYAAMPNESLSYDSSETGSFSFYSPRQPTAFATRTPVYDNNKPVHPFC